MGSLVQIRETNRKSREIRPASYGIENALARKVRREHPSETIDATAAEYGLTYGEAKGLTYGTASRTTINKALKAGGWRLVIEVFSDLLGESLDDFITQEQERIAHARRQQEERAAHLRRMARDLPAVLGLGNDGAS